MRYNMSSDVTYKRTYYLTTSANLEYLRKEAGNVIALTDADGIYYDAIDPNTGKLERRKASGIEFVESLDKRKQEAQTISVVKTGEDEDEQGNTIDLYSGYIWEDNEFHEIFNNSGDFKVKSVALENTSGGPYYLVASPESITSTKSLVKSPDIFITVDGKISADITGTAAKATRAVSASSADTATRAERDSLSHLITDYFKDVSASAVSQGTRLRFTKGDGTTKDVTAKDTTYNVFTSSTAGLVDGYNNTVQEDTTGIILSGSGWISTNDIDLPAAESAVKDGSGNVITQTYVSSAAFNTTSKSLTLYHEDGSAEPTLNIPYVDSTFSTGSNGLVPGPSGSDTAKFLKGNGTWAAAITPDDVYNGTTKGIVPNPPTGAGSTEKYLRSDGSWNGIFSSSANGLVPKTSSVSATYVLRANGTWSAETDTQNTAGATQSSNFLYLVGSPNQNTSNQTYTNSSVYIDGNTLYSNAKQVVNLSDSQALINKTYEGYTLGSACAVDASPSVTQTVLPVTDNFTGDGSTTAFTLSESPISVTSVTVAGTATTAYTISDKTLTFTTAPASSAAIVVDYTKADPSYDTTDVPTNNAVITYVNGVKNTITPLIAAKVDGSVIADLYDATSTYAVGDYCMNDIGNGIQLFKCNTAISTAEAFDPTKWDNLTVMDTQGKWLSGTLTAGSTSITLSDASITTSSHIEVWADNGNVNYTNISSTTGSVTITFLAQASNMTVEVRVF